jgi:23S rRNA pseudouridine2605 synthase
LEQLADPDEIASPEALEADVASEMDAVVSAEPEDLDEESLEEEEPAPHEAPSERELYVGVEPPEYTEPEDAPPRHEERLQKILAHAGIASRRHAEELIAEGHVQVNGQTITAPGHKADPTRDHIRVDGKLLQGSERLRYFVLNKPRGFVTTVSDPEGRPTVMEFFKRQGERLYPVGRLDYQSEGLLLVTNDGPLANQLTRAASGVEKTYLVKVSGTPSEEALEKLRTGVAIAKGRPSEGRVRTSPARIRVVRAGENPWYEVVLVEGRNRELRKMFEEIGHRVEKIRRVAYGPLVLDVPSGTTRELVTEEVDMLRRAAAGKFKSRKIDFSVLLPKEAGRSVDHEAAKERELRGGKRPYGKNFRFDGRGRGRDQDSGQSRGPARGYDRPQGAKPAFGGSGFSKPGFSKPGFGKPGFSKDRPDTRRDERSGDRPARPGSGRDFGGPGGRRFDSRPPQRSFEVRPASGSGDLDAPREGFGRGHEGSQNRRQDRYQDRNQERGEGRGQERGSEQRGFGERSSSGQRGGQSFRPRGERNSFGKGREGGGGKTFGSRPEGRSGFKPGFKPDFRSGDRPTGRPAFKSSPRTGFGAGSGSDSGSRPGGSRSSFGEGRDSGGKRFGPRPEGRPTGRSGFKPGFQSGDRPTGRPSFRPDSRSGSGAGSGSDSGPRARPGGFQSRSEGRPAGRPAFKSGFQSGDRPAGKPAFKSSSRAGSGSGPKPGGSRGGFKPGSRSGPRPGGKPGFKSGGPGRSSGPRRDSNRGSGKGI